MHTCTCAYARVLINALNGQSRVIEECPGSYDYMCMKAQTYVHLAQYGEAMSITTYVCMTEGGRGV